MPLNSVDVPMRDVHSPSGCPVTSAANAVKDVRRPTALPGVQERIADEQFLTGAQGSGVGKILILLPQTKQLSHSKIAVRINVLEKRGGSLIIETVVGTTQRGQERRLSVDHADYLARTEHKLAIIGKS